MTLESTTRLSGLACMAAAAIMLTTGTASADTLKIGYYIGEKHPLVSAGIKPFIEEVKAKSGGEIDFQVFPAGQLFKAGDAVTMIQSGAVDIGLIVIPYHRQEFPISQAVNLPWGWEPWTLTNIYMRATIEDGLIKDEWAKNEMVPLIVATNAPYEIASATKELGDIASISGLKIRSAGGVSDKVLTAIGAVPVAIPTPETFESLQRGTIDATVYAFSNWAQMRLQEVLKHATTNVELAGPSGLTFAISRRVFDGMSPENQKILLDAGHAASLTAQKALLEENVAALKGFQTEGLKTYEWSDADLAALRGKYEAIRAEWEQEMNAAGRPGTDAIAQIEAFHGAAAANPQDLPTR